MEKKRIDGYRILIIISTVIVLSVLVMAAPAEAFNFGLSLEDKKVKKGEIAIFSASIEVDSQEYNDIKDVALRLDSEMKGICKFSIDAKEIFGCSGIDVKKTGEENAGYGIKRLTYKITVDTNAYKPGTYKTFLVLDFIDGSSSEKRGEDLVIFTGRLKAEGCSLKAFDGIVTIEEMVFNRNRLNIYMPLPSAVNGEGYITGQNGRDRFTFGFDVDEILENRDDKLVVRISGIYKVGNFEGEDDAVMTFDKTNNLIFIDGGNVNAQYLKISASDGCMM